MVSQILSPFVRYNNIIVSIKEIKVHSDFSSFLVHLKLHIIHRVLVVDCKLDKIIIYHSCLVYVNR